MSPPPSISTVSAGVRIGGGTFCSGALLLLVTCGLDRIIGEAPGGHRSDASWSSTTTSHLLLMLNGILAVGYVGALRAAVTHGRRHHLALQTCAIFVPCALLARVAGSILLAGLLAP